MNYIKILKNNWKKSSIAAIALGYGIHYLKTNNDISKHMRSVCSELKLTDNSKVRNVLVILNPIANKKTSEQMFKKYCEPILHLAGYSVTIVRTNYIGHAKSYIENTTDLPDAIVIAGGDGTTSEVVTGLMRRNEIITPPVAVLPLGKKNETASKYSNITTSNRLEYVKSLTSTILPMLTESIRNEHLLRVEVIESTNRDEEQKNMKPIYGMNQLSWGMLRDIESYKDKYWYFGALRHHVAALFNSFSNKLVWSFPIHYTYTPPCAGCRNCSPQMQQPFSKLYIRKLFVPQTNQPIMHKTVNEKCNFEVNGYVETNQVNIKCSRNENDFYKLETNFINTLRPGLNFLKNVSNIIKFKIEPTLTLQCRTIQLIPEINTNIDTFFSIDGEEYDVRPIKVSLVLNAIRIFCNGNSY